MITKPCELEEGKDYILQICEFELPNDLLEEYNVKFNGIYSYKSTGFSYKFINFII